MADEILIRSVRLAAPTSTGTQDYTVSGFGTPVAAIFSTVSATVDDTEAPHEQNSYGFTDGTTDRCIYTSGLSSFSTSRCKHGSTDSLIHIPNHGASSTYGEAVFSAWITDGIRINWTTAPLAGVLVVCTLIGGDATAHVGSFTSSGTQDASVNVTAPGFTPDVVMFIGNNASFPGTPAFQSHSSFWCGLAHREDNGSTTQGSLSRSGRDAVSTTSYSGVRSENRCLRRVNPATPSTTAGYEVTAWTASGYTLTTRDGSVATTMAALSLAFGGRRSWIGQPLTPTSTGNASVTGIGFRPTAVFGFVSRTSSASNALTTNGNFGRVIFTTFNPNEEFGQSVTASHGVTTTDIDAIDKSSAIVVEEVNGTRDMLADWVSMDDDGFTLNWTTVDNFARYMLVIAVEEQPLTHAVGDTVEVEEATGFLRGVHATETVEIDDDVQRAATFARAVDETVEIDDDAQRAVTFNRAVNETEEIKESGVRSRTFFRAADDTVEIDEAAQEQLGFVAAVDDTVTISDEGARFLTRSVRVSSRRDSTISGAQAADSSEAGAQAADDGATGGG